MIYPLATVRRLCATVVALNALAALVAAGEDGPPPEALYRLSSAEVARGETVELSFVVRANGDLQGFAWSIDFDEEALEARDAVQVFQSADGAEWEFYRSHQDNTNATPGNGGIDEGFPFGAGVFDFNVPPVPLPPADTDNELLRFVFFVKPSAPIGVSEVAFVDGAHFPQWAPVENVCTVRLQTADLEVEIAAISVAGRLAVVTRPASDFLRGDSDASGEVTLTDAVDTLNFLFLGDEPPLCPDGADADDDGQLTITDPVATLNVLFLGGRALPPPRGVPGPDPSEDGLPDC
jgi:hypothetical protein